MLGERLEENIEVSHDTLGSYSDVMCGEGQDSLRGPRHVRDATPGGDRGGVRVPQYEDQPSQLGCKSELPRDATPASRRVVWARGNREAWWGAESGDPEDRTIAGIYTQTRCRLLEF